MTVSFATQFAESTSPSLTLPNPAVSNGKPSPVTAVSGHLQHALTDAEREGAIRVAGYAIERHMAEFDRTGCFAARGMADRARLLMEALIRGRSAVQVARMEQEMNLR